MRILIVDDSVVFRSQIKSALDGVEGIVVAQTAANGKIALDRLAQTSIDVVILDLEMPEMDGLSTLKEMRAQGFQQKVIVFSATSKEAIDTVFAALNAGASDFITKPNSAGSLEEALEGIQQELVPKVLQFKRKIENCDPLQFSVMTNPQNERTVADAAPRGSSQIYKTNLNLSKFKPRAICIGSSTGGPKALSEVFSKLKGHPLTIPIFIAQHMPPNFTEHLAMSLQTLSGHPAKEGVHGEIVKPGHIYVAPGDFHMTIERLEVGTQAVIRLDKGPKRNSVRPAVDNLFESVAKIYGNLVGAFIFTGMGEDGLLGAQSIKSSSGVVMIQDEASSVVWGMPGAVHAAGAFDTMGDLECCAKFLREMVG